MRTMLIAAVLFQVLALAGAAAAQGIDTGELPPVCKAEEDEALRICNTEAMLCLGAAMARGGVEGLVDGAMDAGKCLFDGQACLDDVATRSAQCQAEVRAKKDRDNELPRPPCPAFETSVWPDCDSSF